MKKHALYLRDISEEKITNDFCSSVIEEISTNKLYWRDISYLWKLYNKMNSYPNIMFINNVKTRMIEKFKHCYNEETDTFMGLTSPYLPNVSRFIDFWKEHIYESCEQNEFEIDEIFNLYQSKNRHPSMTEDIMLDLIIHYFPEVEIEDNKYLLNIGTDLWSKPNDMIAFIEKNAILHGCNISDTYELYKEQHCDAKKRVSKRYFEKFMDDWGNKLYT